MKHSSLFKILILVFLIIYSQPVYSSNKPNTNNKVQNSLPNKQSLKADIILTLDNSGSMKDNDPEFLTRIVVKNFVDGLGKDDRLGMAIFDENATLALPLTEVFVPENKNEFNNSLDQVNYKGQFTNSPAGVERAIYELKTHGRKGAQKVMIFLTDGFIDTGNKNIDLEKERWLKEDLAQECKAENIRIIGIAFTDKADFRLIQTLANKTGGEYFRAYKAEDIKDIFAKINGIIRKPPVQPRKENPPAPARPGDAFIYIISGAVVVLAVAVTILVVRKKPETQQQGIVVQSPQEDLPLPKAELIDVGHVISKKALPLEKRLIELGRDTKCDIPIPKETVSSFHATIEYKDKYFYLEDQRSANGTSLNGRKLEPNKPVRLKSGDRIKLDIYEFQFFLPDQAPLGRTRLSPKEESPQSSGTVLRPSSSPSPLPSPNADVQIEGTPEEVNNEPNKEDEQESATRLKPGMCPNHPARKASEICAVCKGAFCQQCMTQKDGKDICIECSKNPS